jgi:transposase InsO family protein
VAFWPRAHAFFAAYGITVRRVLTNNGSCYRSRVWRRALADASITHKQTRPYRPQTNGKVERYNRTLLVEWAYCPSLPQRNHPPQGPHPMATHLQSPPTPHLTRQQTTHQPCHQRLWAGHLVGGQIVREFPGQAAIVIPGGARHWSC